MGKYLAFSNLFGHQSPKNDARRSRCAFLCGEVTSTTKTLSSSKFQGLLHRTLDRVTDVDRSACRDVPARNAKASPISVVNSIFRQRVPLVRGNRAELQRCASARAPRLSFLHPTVETLRDTSLRLLA